MMRMETRRVVRNMYLNRIRPCSSQLVSLAHLLPISRAIETIASITVTKGRDREIFIVAQVDLHLK